MGYDKRKKKWVHHGYVCRMCNAIVKAPTVAQKHSKTCKRKHIITDTLKSILNEKT